jgi:hypothetical protein
MISELNENEENDTKYREIMYIAMEQFHILEILKKDGCKFKKNWFYLAVERCEPNFLDNLIILDVEIPIEEETKVIIINSEIDREKFEKVYSTLFKLDGRLYDINIKIQNPFTRQQD